MTYQFSLPLNFTKIILKKKKKSRLFSSFSSLLPCFTPFFVLYSPFPPPIYFQTFWLLQKFIRYIFSVIFAPAVLLGLISLRFFSPILKVRGFLLPRCVRLKGITVCPLTKIFIFQYFTLSALVRLPFFVVSLASFSSTPPPFSSSFPLTLPKPFSFWSFPLRYLPLHSFLTLIILIFSLFSLSNPIFLFFFLQKKKTKLILKQFSRSRSKSFRNLCILTFFAPRITIRENAK